MLKPARAIIALCSALGLASTASAQDTSVQIRFTVGDESNRRQGYIDRLTLDSLYLRVRGTDTTAAFARKSIRSLEREHRSHPARAAGIGCLAVGVPLGAFIFSGTHDPDSPGLEKIFGVLGFGVGCGVGALGGSILSLSRRSEWEPWILPGLDSDDSNAGAFGDVHRVHYIVVPHA